MKQLRKTFTAAAALLLTMATAAQAADTNPPTVSYTTADGTTHDPINFSTYSSTDDARGVLKDAVTITATGTWTSAQAAYLKYALKGVDGDTYYSDVENATLTAADLGNATLSGTGTFTFTYMFANCTALTTVTLPAGGAASATVSFERAFYGCAKLTSVANLDRFTTASSFSDVFYGCAALTSVTLPVPADAGKSISFNSAFYGCAKLTSVANLDKYTNVKDFGNVFRECAELESVTLPAGSSTAAVSFSSAFHYCTKLTSVVNFDKFTTVSDFFNTFNGCAALQSITLPVPADAGNSSNFSSTIYNCAKLERVDNLKEYTNIQYLVSTFYNCRKLLYVELGSVPGSASSAFSSANPNCLKYVPAAATIPADWKNVIAEGKAKDDIKLDESYPFRCPQAFSMDGHTISYNRIFPSNRPSGTDGNPAGWQTICLPFTPTAISGTNAAGNAVSLHPFNADGGYEGKGTDGIAPFWLRSLSADGYHAATTLDPDVPYIISMPNNEKYDAKFNVTGTVTLTGTGVTVPATTERASSATAYTLHTNYATVPRSASVYVIDVAGKAFVANSTYADPFCPYVTANGSPAQAPARFAIGDENGGATAIEQSALMPRADGNGGMSIHTTGGVLVIDTPQACTVPVYGVDGRLIRTLRLVEGTNEVGGLPRGAYIVQGVKVVM